MRRESSTSKPGRKVRTLDEEIAYQREKLRKLEDRQREQQRRERERNQKAVMELIKSERLDAVPADLWREAMPKIRTLLVGSPENQSVQQQEKLPERPEDEGAKDAAAGDRVRVDF